MYIFFRYKFVFVTWQKDPDALNVVERARMSSDKALIKNVMTVSIIISLWVALPEEKSDMRFYGSHEYFLGFFFAGKIR